MKRIRAFLTIVVVCIMMMGTTVFAAEKEQKVKNGETKLFRVDDTTKVVFNVKADNSKIKIKVSSKDEFSVYSDYGVLSELTEYGVNSVNKTLTLNKGTYSFDVSKYNYYYDETGDIPVRVSITDLSKKVQKISVDNFDTTLYYGNEYSLSWKLTPEDACNNIKVTNSNKKVISVQKEVDFWGEESLIIKTKKIGTAKITITDAVTGKSKILKVKVKRPELSADNISINVNETATIYTYATPSYLSGSKQYRLTYKSSNPSIARVNSKGLVRGKKAGRTIITVQDKTTGAKTKLWVTVNKKYSIKDKLGKKVGTLIGLSSRLKLSTTTVNYSSYSNSYSKKYSDSSRPTIMLEGFDSIVANGYFYSSMDINYTDSGNAVTGLNLSSDGTIAISFSGDVGKTYKGVVKFKIGGKTLKFNYRYSCIGFTENHYNISRGDTLSLKLSGYKGEVSYSSSNSDVASVSKSGVVSAKAPGVAVITARIKSRKFCTVVNVAKVPGVWAMIVDQQYMLDNWTYSQPNRVQDGYYDCSALIWKSFNKCLGINFGNSYSAWSGSECDWCEANVSQVDYNYTSYKDAKLQPGDIGICFTSDWTSTNSWHATTFAYYSFWGYSYSGQPLIYDVWMNNGPSEYFRAYRPLDVIQ